MTKSKTSRSYASCEKEQNPNRRGNLFESNKIGTPSVVGRDPSPSSPLLSSVAGQGRTVAVADTIPIRRVAMRRHLLPALRFHPLPGTVAAPKLEHQSGHPISCSLEVFSALRCYTRRWLIASRHNADAAI
uniref:Uncharacterized protein n=1 Tax=Plectus sambesii TaxID=2011161 RepID=A0A914WNK1_9BILA